MDKKRERLRRISAALDDADGVDVGDVLRNRRQGRGVGGKARNAGQDRTVDTHGLGPSIRRMGWDFGGSSRGRGKAGSWAL